MIVRVLGGIVVSASVALGNSAYANTIATGVDTFITAPERIGSAELRWLGIKLYRADLYTENGEGFDWKRPFRLDLTYEREFSGSALVKATLFEMERVEGKSSDHDEIGEKLGDCFRDVQSLDTYSAVALDQNSVGFFLNSDQTCTLVHDDIRARFLGIWLSDNSRELAASKALRGLE